MHLSKSTSSYKTKDVVLKNKIIQLHIYIYIDINSLKKVIFYRYGGECNSYVV